MHNDVRDCYGRLIGFRCRQCGYVKDRMWGTTCNDCRASNEQNEKLIEEIRSLKVVISELKTKAE